MDLTQEEIETIFPRDRGCDLDDIDLEPWVALRRTDDEWAVVTADDRCVVDDTSPWDVLTDPPDTS